MYCLKFTLTPTAAMTFRILPGSILNIATYPFVPPTTFSGFLRRLGMLSAGLYIPETRINKDDPPFYALPRHYVALGAYPTSNSWRTVHKTYRKGMREFNHHTFSKLYVESDKANFQLHTWEYLIVEELVGYVVSESFEGLAHFQDLETYGCKLGKEGFAIVTEVSDAIALQRQTVAATPSTVVPMEALLQNNQFISGCDIYNLYRYNWLVNSQITSDAAGFLDQSRTPIDGFIPFVASHYPKEADSAPTLDYYTDGEIFIPVSLVNLLRGEVYV
jgi:CRISPR/Cas system-associated protein Cas5 (RAMP superfamily)